MPLDRQHITIASAVMLPAYAILDALFGVVFISDPEHRLGLAPSLVAAREYLTLPLWGVMWIALTALMTFALIVKARWVFVVALALNIAAWALWAVVVELAVIDQANVSYLAGALPLFVAVASFASLLSLMSREN